MNYMPEISGVHLTNHNGIYLNIGISLAWCLHAMHPGKGYLGVLWFNHLLVPCDLSSSHFYNNLHSLLEILCGC